MYAQLLHSIREFVSDRLGSIASSSDLLPTFRCQDGVVLPGSDGSSDWGTGWVHRSRNRFASHPLTLPDILSFHRRLVFCHFEVHLSRCCLLLHPILCPVDMIPLARSTAVALGSPIRLLPFNTPAYYLGPYTGPTNSLTTQFEDSLRGLGVGGWKDLFHKPTGKHLEVPSYIIAWVAVQNRRGEEKGISVVWPLSLCLAFLPDSLQARQGLLSLPELPTPLRMHSSIPPPSSTTANAPPISPQDVKPPLSSIPTISPVELPPRVAVHSARSLLSLPSRIEQTVDGVSREVSGFVDYVAKEREKERERIKRERDNHSNPISSSQPVTTHTDNLERERTPSPPPVGGLIISDNQEPNEPPPSGACGLFDSSDTSLEDSTQDTPGARGQPPDVAGPYEIYPNFDSPWVQGADQFPTLEIDYEMSFGMEMNVMDCGPGVGGDTGITADIDDICGVFTDDDFNFFDRPTLDENYTGQTQSMSLFHNPLVPQHGAILPVTVPTSPTSGVVMLHESTIALQHHTSPSLSPLTSTPRVDPLPPIDSFESVSSPSISSQSTPSTPQAIVDLRSPSLAHGSSIFDPIWFPPTHRTSDHKYAWGKFSLLDQHAARFSGVPQKPTGWRLRYDDATDPRKSVVRRLAGSPFSSDGNDTKEETITGDEWGNQSEGEDDDLSEVESIDERNTGFAEAADISVLLDRPCTPPPQFTPLGPSLLDCQFHHSHLLPLSRPLHSPSSTLTATGLQGIVPTISVPTPVSPPAMSGEKLKSWEAAMGLLVREVVENPLWAESWQINNNHAFRATSFKWSTCQGEVSQLTAALDTLDDSRTSLEMGTLFDMSMTYTPSMLSCSPLFFIAVGSLQPHQGDISSSLQSMEPPFFSVGKGSNIINISPSVIRFWEKTGLHPLGGRKNVNAFVLYGSERTDLFGHASQWFKRVSNAYTVRLYFACNADRVYILVVQEFWVPRVRPFQGRLTTCTCHRRTVRVYPEVPS